MKIGWEDNTSRSLSTGEALEMVQYRAEVGPFTLWAREDGMWDVEVNVTNGDGNTWSPPSGDVANLEEAKVAAERGMYAYFRRLMDRMAQQWIDDEETP